MKYLLVFFLLLCGCTNPPATVRILTAEGYTSIKITGYAWFMNSKEELYSTGFEATNINGKFIKGAVTGGLFKGYTIRHN